MKGIEKYLWLLLLVVFAASCKKDVPPKLPGTSGSITTSKRLMICNEGQLNSGNATISIYDPSTDGVLANAYGASNSNQYVGDILQSGIRFNGKYYWMANNSHKIVITDNKCAVLGTVAGLISPRYMQPVSNNKAYVSSYLFPGNTQPNYVQVLDLNTHTVTKNIRVDGWTEQMVEAYGKVYVCNQAKKYVYVINSANDQLVDSIFVNAGTSQIVKDKNEKLWVSCNAYASSATPARLLRIDPLADSVEADISLQTMQNSIARMSVNGNGDMLYYLMNDVFKFSINDFAPSPAFILHGAHTFYGLCVDPEDETVYISDAIDYNQNGNVLRYKSDGTFVTTFKVGLIPGHMWIDE